jgi:hypothetical protein
MQRQNGGNKQYVVIDTNFDPKDSSNCGGMVDVGRCVSAFSPLVAVLVGGEHKARSREAACIF